MVEQEFLKDDKMKYCDTCGQPIPRGWCAMHPPAPVEKKRPAPKKKAAPRKKKAKG